MDVLSVENLSVKNGDKTVIDDISFLIKKKSVNAVLSSNNSCKTTLIKTLSGIISLSDGNISVNDIDLNETFFRKYILNISTILDDIDEQFICDTVKEEIEYPLINLNYKDDEISKMFDYVTDLLKINSIVNKKIDNLTTYEKVKTLLAASIVHKPKILFIDDILRFLDDREKSEILKFFNSICDELNISILFTTSNLNDLKNINNIIVLKDGKIIMQDSFDNIILEDNELSKMGIEIPLMIDLSRKLQFYKLLDKVYYDRDKVVDKLWK